MTKYIVVFSVFFNVLFAHPHTFVDVFPTVESKNSYIKTIHFKWRFDEMTSQMLIMEWDQNMNGKIDSSELSLVEGYFNSLQDYNYYTDIKLSKKRIQTKPLNFNAHIENSTQIIYEFDVAINTPKEDLQIDFYDQDRFTAFVLKKEFVKSDLAYDVADVDNDFYFAYRLQFN